MKSPTQPPVLSPTQPSAEPVEEGWRENAECRRRSDVDFFPAIDDRSAVTSAKVICASCGVLEACLDFALETNQPDGVWGGLTPKERARMRRRLDDLDQAS